MIVKVQISLHTSHPKARALICDESKTFFVEMDAPDLLVERMDGTPKAFFNAHVKDEEIILDDEAPWQDW